jgi:hypothetical protein
MERLGERAMPAVIVLERRFIRRTEFRGQKTEGKSQMNGLA